MKYRNLSIWRNIDKPLLIMYLLLSFIGYFIMYSSSFKGINIQTEFWSANYGKQLIWIIITLFAGLFILLLDGSFIKNTAYFTYGFILLLLILVLLTPPIKGARSWFYFTTFSIQPSEFIKLTLSLSLAKLLSDVGSRFQEFRTKLKAFFLIIIPALLIAVQPDPGTMLVFACFIFVLYREGLSGNFLLIGLFTVLIAVVGIFLKASNSVFNLAGNAISGNIFFVLIIILGFIFSFLIIKIKNTRFRKGYEKFYIKREKEEG